MFLAGAWPGVPAARWLRARNSLAAQETAFGTAAAFGAGVAAVEEPPGEFNALIWACEKAFDILLTIDWE